MKYALPRMVAACCALAAAACDSLATGDFRPPYLTIHGTIDATQIPSVPSPQVAILWDSETPGNYTAQSVDRQVTLTDDFTITVNQPPPEAALHPVAAKAAELGLDPTMLFAHGIIAVYSDDGNGKLDITSTLGASPDRVLAAVTDLDVFYLARGKPAPSTFTGTFPVAPGFSLTTAPPWSDPTVSDCGGSCTTLIYCQPQKLQIPTAIAPGAASMAIKLIDDPDLQRFTCASFWGPLEYPDWQRPGAGAICDGGQCPFCSGCQCPLDLPQPGDAVTCADDRLSYVFKRCENDAALCGTRFCHYGHGTRAAADPPPPGWPCP
jgi:hypothetical protein